MSNYCVHCGIELLKAIKYPEKNLVLQKTRCSNPKCGIAYDSMNYARIKEELNKQINEAEKKVKELEKLKLSLTLVMKEDDSRELLRTVYSNVCTCSSCRPDMHEGPDCSCFDCQGFVCIVWKSN